jgi:hypothetical protein
MSIHIKKELPEAWIIVSIHLHIIPWAVRSLAAGKENTPE